MFNISSPLLPLFLFSPSEESAICLSSSKTKLGITKVPSINPVLHKSAILPSIITDVSRTLGVPLYECLTFLSLFDPTFLKFPNAFRISSFFFIARSAPKTAIIIFITAYSNLPTLGTPVRTLNTSAEITKNNIAPTAPNIISIALSFCMFFSI